MCQFSASIGTCCVMYIYLQELDKLLGGGGSFEEFITLDNFNRTGFILGCENCMGQV